LSSQKLNIFQRLTRQWDVLHPYNAVQAMRLAGRPDAAAIDRSLHEMLRELAVGCARVRANRYSIERPPDDSSVPLMQIAAGTTLDELITAELNRPFAGDGAFLRPFLLPASNSYWLGMIYHHWAADSQSIRMLLREWLLRLVDPARARRQTVAPARGGYLRLFGLRAGGWDGVDGFFDALRWSSRFRSVRRIDAAAGGVLHAQFSRHELPDGLVDPLRAFARRRGVTVNDLFLAALAEAADRFVIEPPGQRRHNLALGTIVDLRQRNPHLRATDAADAFGTFLGFTSVTLRPHDLANFDRRVIQIAAQNRQNIRAKTAQTSMIRLTAGVIAGRMMSGHALMEFYRKRLPLAAGISNVNLAETWVADRHPATILEYARASPTGPMLPLVITPTTLGQKLHFGMTSRTAVLDAPQRDAVVRLIRERLIAAAS
jgi:hypothetical protein